MERILVLFILLTTYSACKTPERFVAQEPSEEEVNLTIKKVLRNSIFTSTSNILKANRNGLLNIMPESFDSVLYHMNASENEEAVFRTNVNEVIANSVEYLQNDLNKRLKEYQIEHGYQMILNHDKSITKEFAKHYYQPIEMKLAQYLRKEITNSGALEKEWHQAVVHYNSMSYSHHLDPDLFNYLGKHVVTYLFDEFANREMVLRENISFLQDATATRVFNYYTQSETYIE